MKKVLVMLAFGLSAVFSCGEVCPYEPPLLFQEVKTYHIGNSPLPNNDVRAIVSEGTGIYWLGTPEGLARFDQRNDQWQVFHHANSPLPSDNIRALAIDWQMRLWVGTDQGLAVLDNGIWKVYEPSNSHIPNNAITQIVSHPSQDLVWVGTEKGLFKVEGSTQTFYDDSNSGLMDEIIYSLALGASGELWIGAFDHFNHQGRVYRFHNDQWQVKKLENLGLTSSFPYGIAIDQSNAVWISVSGTATSALVKVTDSEWLTYDHSNSSLPLAGIYKVSSRVNSLYLIGAFGLGKFTPSLVNEFQTTTLDFPKALIFDELGRIWVATSSGVIVFNEREY